MTGLYCFLAAINGYFAVKEWPSPISVVSAGVCLWMVVLAFKYAKVKE